MFCVWEQELFLNIWHGNLQKFWLSTEHLGGKYAKRVEAMMNYEKIDKYKIIVII